MPRLEFQRPKLFSSLLFTIDFGSRTYRSSTCWPAFQSAALSWASPLSASSKTALACQISSQPWPKRFPLAEKLRMPWPSASARRGAGTLAWIAKPRLTPPRCALIRPSMLCHSNRWMPLLKKAPFLLHVVEILARDTALKGADLALRA